MAFSSKEKMARWVGTVYTLNAVEKGKLYGVVLSFTAKISDSAGYRCR